MTAPARCRKGFTIAPGLQPLSFPCLPPRPSCPSCRSAMQVHALPGNHGKPVELDLCFACQGM
ncbi:MAG: zf-TFIIB domain-containing protein [Burkholderiales bacterium]|nr:zf-TFIIB domain-containing protein [Burkholderiales bacterium]